MLLGATLVPEVFAQASRHRDQLPTRRDTSRGGGVGEVASPNIIEPLILAVPS